MPEQEKDLYNLEQAQPSLAKKHNSKQSAKFSYKPFEYSFQECYEVD